MCDNNIRCGRACATQSQISIISGPAASRDGINLSYCNINVNFFIVRSTTIFAIGRLHYHRQAAASHRACCGEIAMIRRRGRLQSQSMRAPTDCVCVCAVGGDILTQFIRYSIYG